MVFRLIESGNGDYLPLDVSELQMMIRYFLRGRRRIKLGIKLLVFVADTMDMGGVQYVNDIMNFTLEDSILKSVTLEDKHNGY